MGLATERAPTRVECLLVVGPANLSGMTQPLSIDPDTDDRAGLSSEDRAIEARLALWFRDHGSALIGFSGGVDSAYLACLAVDALGRERVLAVIGRSASYPEEQWVRARNIARDFGVPVLEVSTDELNDARYAANPSNRCYFCKTELWGVLGPIARERGLAVVVDGTNADDLSDHRPGARAAMEHGVRSPLAELGVTKAAIRRLSRARGIPTWTQPASPCLSSRIPYGTAVTIERLRQIEHAERLLREAGVVGDLRVRYHGDLARVEIGSAALDDWTGKASCQVLVRAARSAGFGRVALDVRGFRSGSLNLLGGVVAEPLVRASASSGAGDASRLSQALWRDGIACVVEARERLALVTPSSDDARASALASDMRATILEVARSHGFTHVAIELPAAGSSSTLGDSVAGDDATVPRD